MLITVGIVKIAGDTKQKATLQKSTNICAITTSHKLFDFL